MKFFASIVVALLVLVFTVSYFHKQDLNAAIKDKREIYCSGGVFDGGMDIAKDYEVIEPNSFFWYGKIKTNDKVINLKGCNAEP
jgi:hypothetical protein